MCQLRPTKPAKEKSEEEKNRAQGLKMLKSVRDAEEEMRTWATRLSGAGLGLKPKEVKAHTDPLNDLTKAFTEANGNLWFSVVLREEKVCILCFPGS